MAQPLDAVLSQPQRDSLRIEKFIFHIIDPDNVENEEGVVYLDEVILQDRQEQFFLDRLRDIAEGTQYIFKEDAVHLKEKCEEITAEDADFIKISRQITADFAGRHDSQMSAGVFVIAIVEYLRTAHNWQKLTLLLKMDKSPSFSYNYKDEGGRRIAILEEISNALSENKAAIQKSAVIDSSNCFTWDVLAYDRVKKPYLADYYKAFLGVTERHQDSQLTLLAHGTVRRWARGLSKDDMPPGEDAISYVGRSLHYLEDHDQFDTETFLAAVVRDENPANKGKLMDSLKAELVQCGVAGQRFTPTPGSLPNRIKKQVYETIEGVTVSFEGDKTAAGLSTQDLPGGGAILTIETQKLTLKP